MPCFFLSSLGAISIRTNMDEVWDAINDPDTRVIAQVAPAVRVAVGDAFGLTKGHSVMGKLVAVLHRMGFDEVYGQPQLTLPLWRSQGIFKPCGKE